LFFFASYQGTQQTGSPGNQVYTTIPIAERGLNGADAVFPASTPVMDPLTGKQFPNNTIPNSRINPQPEKFFSEFLPAPNLGNNSYQFPSTAAQQEHQAIGKVDYTLTKADSLFVRYFLDDYPSTGYGNGTGSALGTSWLSNFPYRYQDTTVGWVHTFSPSLLNVAHVTYQRSVFGEQTSLPFSLTAIGYDVNTESAYSAYGLTPDSSLSITGAFGAYPGAPTRDIMPTWDINDNLTWIKGRHTISTGFVIYHNRINELQNFFTGGSMTFSGQFSGTGASDFLLGDFSNYTQISGLSSRLHQTLPSAYVQDDIKLTPRVTVNAGLRVDVVSGYHSEDGQLMTLQPGQQSTVFPLATQSLLFAGDKGVPADIIGTRTDIAPRLGIAWDVFGNGKTSLRAGAGIFYIPMTEGISLNRQTLIQPFTLEVSLNAGDAQNIWAQPPFNGNDPYPIASSPSGLKAVPFVIGGSETTMPTKWKTQVSNEWSLSIQQALFKSGVFEVDYVGSSSSHMFTSAQANWGQYINVGGGPPTESNLQQRRIYPDIGPIELDADLLSANYNALQLSYNQRLANTLTLKSSYTWSKNLGVNSGEGAGGNGPRDPYNYHLDYSPVSNSEPQVFVTALIWQAFGGHTFGSKLMQYAAGGWQVGGIASINSGTPLDIVSGIDNSLTGIGQDTPDVIGSWHANNNSRADSIAHWFNPAAFTQNATGTFGTLRPNTLSGPGYVNFDINLQKNFAITEKVRSEFRSSFYNAFNHANLGNPGTTLTSSNFGVINSINSASNPRVIEFGLRVLF
jgi:hypothetical protein